MSSTVSLGRPWPPSPSVEDECESLSREFLDPSVLNIMLNNDTVVPKGTVDQYPLILPSDIVTPCSTPTDTCGSPIDPKSACKSSNGNIDLAIAQSLPNTSRASGRRHGPNVSTPPSSHHQTSKPNNVLSELPIYHESNISSGIPDVLQPHGWHFSEGDEKLDFRGTTVSGTEWHSDDELRTSHGAINGREILSNTVPIKKQKRVNFQLPDEPPEERVSLEAELPLEHEFELPDGPSTEIYTSRGSSMYYEDELLMDNYDPTFITRQDNILRALQVPA
ncbi:conserved hypothetical protein [Histoplasma capsulatum H143]|uniref:Uncharacterized protein n=1 Tax=Ajellomyces capsulatus (strain H143) TaxID=544712 RepID=C6HM30_AJECH|nr:conserved hypothetical protein [Histoplasma capsulatum H143]